MGLRGNELRRQRVRDEFRQRRAGQQQIDDVVAAEGAALAEEMLAAVVMPGGAKAERAAVGIDAPACEGTCGRLEIGFGVAPLAEREELEQLAGDVLVGRLAAALRVVEVDQDRKRVV